MYGTFSVPKYKAPLKVPRYFTFLKILDFLLNFKCLKCGTDLYFQWKGILGTINILDIFFMLTINFLYTFTKSLLKE